jgi:hypothetical protein
MKIDDKRISQILFTLISLYNQKIEVNEMQLKRDLSDVTEEELKIFKKKDNEVYNEKELHDCIDTLIKNRYEAEIIECKRKMNEADTKEEEALQINRIYELNQFIHKIKENRNVKKTSN